MMIPLTLIKTEEAAAGTRSFYFTKPENFTFKPGQYVAMKLDRLVAPDARGPVRSLSIASAPCEDFLMFTLRRSESGFKQSLWSLEPGASVMVTPPVGFFTLAPDDARPAVFLIGGVGITPVRSILCEAREHGERRPLILLYANRTIADAPFAEELRALEMANLEYIDVLSQTTEGCQPGREVCGYITQELIEKQVDNPGGAVYYIVGSPTFIQAMEQILDGMGIPADQRHKDPFTGLGSINPALVRA